MFEGHIPYFVITQFDFFRIVHYQGKYTVVFSCSKQEVSYNVSMHLDS